MLIQTFTTTTSQMVGEAGLEVYLGDDIVVGGVVFFAESVKMKKKRRV